MLEAHRLGDHSTLDVRAIKTKRRRKRQSVKGVGCRVWEVGSRV